MAAFSVPYQQQTYWCWSALTVGVNAFLGPQPAAGPWSQCSLATQVLLNENAIQPGVNCCQNGACNQDALLNDALTVSGNLAAGGFLQNEYLLFNHLEQQLGLDLPVCARVLWFAGGAHFIALGACGTSDDGTQLVYVQDPLYGPSIQTYDDLVNDYQPPGGTSGAIWNDTYLLQV